MGKWQHYKEEAAELAAPYLKRAGDCMETAAGKIRRGCRHGQKKVKRKMRLLRIKRTLDVLSSIFMLAAAVIAVGALIQKIWQDRFED